MKNQNFSTTTKLRGNEMKLALQNVFGEKEMAMIVLNMAQQLHQYNQFKSAELEDHRAVTVSIIGKFLTAFEDTVKRKWIEEQIFDSFKIKFTINEFEEPAMTGKSSHPEENANEKENSQTICSSQKDQVEEADTHH